MNKMNYLILILQLMIGISGAMAQSRSVVFTFDDLPGTHGDLADFKYINSHLLDILSEHEVPAVGFVNESKLYVDGEPDQRYMELIRSWLDAGQELGNHTYSHVYIDQASIEEYREEVIRGEMITRPLMNEFGEDLRYFRHTQLRTGPTETYRQQLNRFLEEKGYTVAPVTIDNDEYIYAYCYQEAGARNDQEARKLIREEYISYMIRIFDFYESLSVKFLGYEVNQILLLHANSLNADTLDELIPILRDRGYQFITLEEALKDEAYSLPEAQSERGLSWLFRWMLAQGAEPDEQPSVSNAIMVMFNRYR